MLWIPKGSLSLYIDSNRRPFDRLFSMVIVLDQTALSANALIWEALDTVVATPSVKATRVGACITLYFLQSSGFSSASIT